MYSIEDALTTSLPTYVLQTCMNVSLGGGANGRLDAKISSAKKSSLPRF